MKFPEKKLVLFDLDDTLAPSKGAISESMAKAITELLKHTHAGIITGGKWEQVKQQVIDRLSNESSSHIHKLYVLPTCGTRLRRYSNGVWEEVYAELLSDDEVKIITDAINESLLGMYDMSTLYGDIVENRGSQITLSALGQQAPIHIKETFDPKQKIRKAIVEKITPKIPNYEIRIGGSTSIDITKKGMDKGYGIRRIAKHLGLTLNEIGFVGDAIFPGGNDYPAKELGLDCISVSGPHETEKHILSWIR